MMKRFKYLMILVLILVSTILSHAQWKRVDIQVFGSPFFNSNRTDIANTSEFLYKELRIQSNISKHFAIGVFAGHQIRKKGEYLIYYVNMPGLFVYQEGLSIIRRTYMPIGLFGELDFTDFFIDELKIIKRKEKWKIYNNVQLVHLTGHNEYLRANPNGLYILGFHKFEKDFGRTYIGFMFGVRRYFNQQRSFSVSLEAGKGALMNAQFGLGFHLNNK